ncbi:MAG: thermosome subunit alpha [Halobacteriota archaeon]
MGSPIFILGEDAQRTTGRDAQQSNIAAGKAVAESVRTTLGPRGMDKMLVDSSGTVVITNDGATILAEMDIEHPAAQMLVEVAETQEDAVGDGTTTASVLAGQLLVRAEELLSQDVHPTTVAEGYARARDIALEAIDDLVIDGDVDDETLERVARTSMTGKGTGHLSAEALAEYVVRAIRAVEDEEGVNRDDVRVHTQVGASSGATELVEGVVVDGEAMRDEMSRRVDDATVAVLDAKIEPRETSTDVEYNITDVRQLDEAIAAEEAELGAYADALIEAGIDVLVATKDVDDRVAAQLARAGVVAFEDVSSADARAIATATGSSMLGDVRDIDADDLGFAESVRVETYGDDDLIFVEGGADAKSVTLFVRGGTEHVVDELERALGDALDVATVTITDGGVVPGAGMTEIRVADAVRDAAAGVEGRGQLAVEAFADALEVIPRTLAENMGMDPIDALVDLRAANESGSAGVVSAGETGIIADPVERGIVDPAAVKREAIESATEAATMIVRIDDVIAAE